MKKLSVVVVLAIVMAGCIHKPSGPVSAWERVNVNLAALAQVNNDLAKGIIGVQQAGLISAQQAAPVLSYQELVAKDHAAIESILAAGARPAADQSAKVLALLEEIKAQGTALVQSGGLGVKNPKSQETFTSDLQALVNLAEVVIGNFNQATGGK